MSRPRFKIRELVLVGAPCLALIGGAAFFSHQQAVQERNANGPYKTEISRVDVLPASPFEAWQGFDTKIVVAASRFGRIKTPLGIQLPPENLLCENVRLVGKVKGQQKSFAVTSVGYGDGLEPEHPGVLRSVMTPGNEEFKDTITFLARTSVFDEGTPVQLQGELWSERSTSVAQEIHPLPIGWTSERTQNSWQLEVRSTTASIKQRLVRVANISVDRTAPPVDKITADLLSPVYLHTNTTGDTLNGVVHIDFKPGSFSGKLPSLRSTAAQIFDSQGRLIKSKYWDGTKAEEIVDWDSSTNPVSAVVRVPVEAIPLSRGALKMKVWFAVEDGWPTLVEAEVRPAWMSKRPRTLKLESVHVAGGNVVATVAYTGNMPLKYEGRFVQGGRNKRLFFDGRDDTSVTLIPGVNYKRLFTDWSQHYTLANGKSYWYSNTVRVQSVSCDANNRCRVTYTSNALAALKAGESARFSAHIGIQGDGFLPIEATITRPKK